MSDSKTIAIWVLSIALVIVGVLYIREAKRPDTVKEFSAQMNEASAQMTKDCGDLSTEDKRKVCIESLQKVSALMGDFFEVTADSETKTSY